MYNKKKHYQIDVKTKTWSRFYVNKNIINCIYDVQ